MFMHVDSFALFYARLYDITFGAVIGILANLLLFPIKPDKEFRNNVIPLLQAYKSYLFSIIDLLFHPENTAQAEQQRWEVEKKLQTQHAFFPEWVYEKGLSLSLQPGYRHFLIMTERLGQILFSMHYLAKHDFPKELLSSFQAPFLNYIAQTEKIFAALIMVLSLQQRPKAVGDLSDELGELDQMLKKTVPLSVELLDISPNYIKLAALIENLRDFRSTLIQLGWAVR